MGLPSNNGDTSLKEGKPEPQYIKDFCRFLNIDLNICMVAHMDVAVFPRRKHVENVLAEYKNEYSVIVFLDSGKLSKFQKVKALLVRDYSINLIDNALRQRGLDVIKSYVLYPSAERVTFSYERRTSAARYAESMLMTSSNHLLVQRLHAVLSRTRLGSPSVELVAVVGHR